MKSKTFLKFIILLLQISDIKIQYNTEFWKLKNNKILLRYSQKHLPEGVTGLGKSGYKLGFPGACLGLALGRSLVMITSLSSSSNSSANLGVFSNSSTSKHKQL